MSKGLSRRDFMKASVIGGAALGCGLGHGHFHLTY
ncbi:MAG: twin-arginine translocation signal domain-containing protein, partial [Deltaproteobacteria bacterium]|nr:twin-arginine translocation signal domain-containing protein [Deltaproteobacteria bacterium]